MNKYKEAIRRIEEHKSIHFAKEYPRAIKITEALNMAIKALEKATSKKGVWIADNFGDKTLSCPNCKKPIINVWSKRDYKPHYCHYCGQRIDWSEDDES